MAKKKKNFIKLVCKECKTASYITHKSHNATTAGVKLELKKHCPKCKKHTVHKEGKR